MTITSVSFSQIDLGFILCCLSPPWDKAAEYENECGSQ